MSNRITIGSPSPFFMAWASSVLAMAGVFVTALVAESISTVVVMGTIIAVVALAFGHFNRCPRCGERVTRRRFTLFGERWPFDGLPISAKCSRCGISLRRGATFERDGAFERRRLFTWQPQLTARQWRIVWVASAIWCGALGTYELFTGSPTFGAYALGAGVVSFAAFLFWPPAPSAVDGKLPRDR
jgi:hypothetical protein